MRIDFIDYAICLIWELNENSFKIVFAQKEFRWICFHNQDSPTYKSIVIYYIYETVIFNASTYWTFTAKCPSITCGRFSIICWCKVSVEDKEQVLANWMQWTIKLKLNNILVLFERRWERLYLFLVIHFRLNWHFLKSARRQYEHLVCMVPCSRHQKYNFLLRMTLLSISKSTHV